MKARLVLFAVAGSSAAMFAGCGAGEGSAEGDGECGALLRFSCATYRPVSVRTFPFRGRAVGEAGFLGCDDRPAPGLGKVSVFAIDHVDTSDAVLVPDQDGSDGLYVARNADRDNWPRVVKAANRSLKCTDGGLTFHGIWNLIYTDGEPGPSLYKADVPYRASFTAKRIVGGGDQWWASATIRADVTAQTRPVPSLRTIKAAIKHHHPVDVSVGCGDHWFEVRSVRLAD